VGSDDREGVPEQLLTGPALLVSVEVRETDGTVIHRQVAAWLECGLKVEQELKSNFQESAGLSRPNNQEGSPHSGRAFCFYM